MKLIELLKKFKYHKVKMPATNRHMGDSNQKTITLPLTFGILFSSCASTARANKTFPDLAFKI